MAASQVYQDSMAILSIFKRAVVLLKIFFFEAAWNREYFAFVKFSDNLFALSQRDISFSSRFVSEKRSSKFILEKNKLVFSANMTGFSFCEHLSNSFPYINPF